ncbi:MAG: PEP-CTERM sorting domain-containing protein [Hassallia sp.]
MKLNKQFTAIAISLTVSNLVKEMMNYKKSLTFIGLITTSVALSSNPAQAFNFNTSTDLGSCSALAGPFTSSGLSSTTIKPNCKTDDGFTITPNPEGKELQGKKVNGVIGVGVSGNKPVRDVVGGEINYGESIVLTLPNPRDVLKNIGLSFLYRPGVFADTVWEAARITTNTGLEGILTVTGKDTASWTFAGGSVTNFSHSKGNGGGYYNIANPFGNAKFDFLTLTPVTYDSSYDSSVVAKTSNANSDFALTHAAAKSVPEPTTLAGLGLVGGLLLATRRRKAIQS